jgi:hypothetical protein
MNFDELQKAWQSKGHETQMTINTDLLLQEVRRNQRHFEATIFWRDAREIGVAMLLTGLFGWWGIMGRNWPVLVMALACLGVGIFMLVDRVRQRRKQPAKADPLKACVEASLVQVNHQIWLLKNVLWWYLLPLGASLLLIFGREMWQSGSAKAAIVPAVCTLGCVVLYWGIYRLNQYAVRKALEPRMQELQTLQNSLG